MTIILLQLLAVTNADDGGDDDDVDVLEPMAMLKMIMLPKEMRICDQDGDRRDINHDDGAAIITLMSARAMTIMVLVFEVRSHRTARAAALHRGMASLSCVSRRRCH